MRGMVVVGGGGEEEHGLCPDSVAMPPDPVAAMSGASAQKFASPLPLVEDHLRLADPTVT